jgi:hypothetical protein
MAKRNDNQLGLTQSRHRGEITAAEFGFTALPIDLLEIAGKVGVDLLSLPLLPPIASRNLLSLPSLPYQHSTSIGQGKEAKSWTLCGHGGEKNGCTAASCLPRCSRLS